MPLPGFHAFMVLIDNSGNTWNETMLTWEFRAGPTKDNDNLFASMSPLIGAQDNVKGSVYSINVQNNNCSCQPEVNKLLQTAKNINASNIPYSNAFPSTNSNAAVTTGLSDLGLSYPTSSQLPWKVRPLPGWGTPLPITSH